MSVVDTRTHDVLDVISGIPQFSPQREHNLSQRWTVRDMGQGFVCYVHGETGLALRPGAQHFELGECTGTLGPTWLREAPGPGGGMYLQTADFAQLTRYGEPVRCNELIETYARWLDCRANLFLASSVDEGDVYLPEIQADYSGMIASTGRNARLHETGETLTGASWRSAQHPVVVTPASWNHPNQQWAIDLRSDGNYMIANVATGNLLTIDKAQKAVVTESARGRHEPTDDPRYLWEPRAHPDGVTAWVHRATGRALRVGWYYRDMQDVNAVEGWATEWSSSDADDGHSFPSGSPVAWGYFWELPAAHATLTNGVMRLHETNEPYVTPGGSSVSGQRRVVTTPAAWDHDAQRWRIHFDVHTGTYTLRNGRTGNVLQAVPHGVALAPGRFQAVVTGSPDGSRAQKWRRAPVAGNAHNHAWFNVETGAALYASTEVYAAHSAARDIYGDIQVSDRVDPGHRWTQSIY